MALTIEQFKVDNMIFEDIKKHSTGDLSYQRIPIKYLESGRSIDLCIATPELITYGIQENRQRTTAGYGEKSLTDKPVESYSLPLIMSDNASISVFEAILKRCQEHLNDKSVKKALGKFNMTPEKMDIFYRKRDDGELVIGAPPTMYPKLFTKYESIRNPDKSPQITTEFYDMNDVLLSASSLIGRRCKVIAAIKVRDIYVGANPSIQLKVNDVIVVEMLDRSHRLLSLPQRPKVDSAVVTTESLEEKEI